MNIVNVRLSALAVLFTLVACDKAGDQADVALAAEQVETTETAVSGSAASVATNEPEQTPKEIPKPPPSAEGANSAEGRPAMKGCYVSGRYYPHLAKFKVDCHLCSCSNGGYVCTRNNCATGDPLKSNLR